MEKYKRYYGLVIFIVAIVLLLGVAYLLVGPKYQEVKSLDSEIETLTASLDQKKSLRNTVEAKKKKLKDSLINSQKRIYSPIDSGLENDTLFFTLYNDVIEMLHANSVKIKSIDYTYNPTSDIFVQLGKDVYFVCDVNMQIVSNYVNLGKFVQDLYQYPYYIRINNIDTKPYQKDKKILISDISLRLYAHTSPDEITDDAPAIDGAQTALPQ